jgi:hypothetical protein
MKNSSHTWYKIYKKLCKELDIEYPLQQKELCIRINPIPNILEFNMRNISKEELNNNREEMAIIYYNIMKQLGSIKFSELTESAFNNNKFKDMKINLLTIISVLYLSGYKNDLLLNKAYNYIIHKGECGINE